MRTRYADLKYFAVLTIPFGVFFSLYMPGINSYLIPIMNFIGIPILDAILPKVKTNLSPAEEENKLSNKLFDWLLYINVPLQFFLLFYMLYVVTSNDFHFALWEKIGKVWSMGICCAVLGINSAHELGHRKNKFEQFLSKALLLTSLYMHFFVEHNRGHHKKVSTPQDPAFARKGLNVYAFLLRSMPGEWLSAWNIEKNRMEKNGRSVWSWENDMIKFHLVQFLFVGLIWIIFGWVGVLAFVIAAVIGIMVMETINYIEHYGLQRKEISPGVYEKVQPWHSWNSDHILGRIMLFELTRHSDHHYKANRKYQVLRHFDESPQLLLGYPGSMVLAWLPPVWFRVMDRRIVIPAGTVPENSYSGETEFE